uniref:Putative calphotin n=1 Tax=Oryza sativa subsp. japonica TaxID=39947 RepID=Q6UUS6_ORYSJ|nr:putative calphotin [Oryza sativa Japonica Group]
MEPENAALVSFLPGRPSPFQPYLNPPRTSSVRFRLSPPFLLARFELATSLSLSAVTVELRSATVVAPDRFPPRRRLLRLRRTVAAPVHPLVELADRRSAAVPVDPSRAAAFLRSGRLFRRHRRSRGRARRLPPTAPAWPPSGTPSGCRVGARPSAARALGVFHAVLVSVQLPPAALVASSPVPVVVLIVVAFVPPSSRSRSSSAFRQVSRCSPVVVFVLGSASSSVAPAAYRLRPRIAAEVVPSPFVSVVPGRLRRARSSLSFPRLVACW